MLCKFCSSIDLDQLATDKGFKHHASCTDLLQSARNGCESCEFIRDSQWIKVGGNLKDDGIDLGFLGMQIVVRAVNQKPGGYHKLRFGQETRMDHNKVKIMTGYYWDTNFNFPESPFLWIFLNIATSDEYRSSNYLSLRTLVDRAPENWHILASGWLNNCITKS